MRITPAASLFRDAPTDLPALVFSERPRSGASVRLLAVGDIGFSGRVLAAAASLPMSYDSLLSDLAPFLRSGDVVFGNVEFPLVSDLHPGGLFAADPVASGSLSRSGFTIANLANNHCADFGPSGLARTIQAVKQSGMLPLGVGETESACRNMVRTDVNGVRIGWLGCGRTLISQQHAGPYYWEFDEDSLARGVEVASAQVDVLIVSIHIGLSFVDYPRPSHKKMAERLMESGASLILMHHAHVLQGVQVTAEGKVSCYNLGNFLLDPLEGEIDWPVMMKEQTESAIFAFDLDSHGVATAAALPVYMDEKLVLRWAFRERGDEIISRLERISADLTSDFTVAFERQRAERNTSGLMHEVMHNVSHGRWKVLIKDISRVRLEHLSMLCRYGIRQLLGLVHRA